MTSGGRKAGCSLNMCVESTIKNRRKDTLLFPALNVCFLFFVLFVFYFVAVRPKLNVKPSVVKPAGQVKPPPKKRRVEGSAVAAVKPMNSSTADQQVDCSCLRLSYALFTIIPVGEKKNYRDTLITLKLEIKTVSHCFFGSVFKDVIISECSSV